MLCPLCTDTVLDVTHRFGIEVDVCPRCRGVWLDRGELDRLLGDAPLEGHRATRPREESAHDRPHSKKAKKRRFADRLSDVLEEVLDF
jgi:Zn-finger nucleic acid-binding protein